MPQTPPFGGKPPAPPPGKLPRPATQPGGVRPPDARDVTSWQALQERQRLERERRSAPEVFEGEDITGSHPIIDEAVDRPARQMARAKNRTVEGRVDHLEQKLDKYGESHEKLADKVDAMGSKVDTMSGSVDALNKTNDKLVGILTKQQENRDQHDHVTFTAKVEVDKQREEAKIEVEKTDQILKLKDEAAKRKEKRKRITLIAGGIVGLLSGWEGLKALFSWLSGHL